MWLQTPPPSTTILINVETLINNTTILINLIHIAPFLKNTVLHTPYTRPTFSGENLDKEEIQFSEVEQAFLPHTISLLWSPKFQLPSTTTFELSISYSN